MSRTSYEAQILVALFLGSGPVLFVVLCHVAVSYFLPPCQSIFCAKFLIRTRRVSLDFLVTNFVLPGVFCVNKMADAATERKVLQLSDFRFSAFSTSFLHGYLSDPRANFLATEIGDFRRTIYLFSGRRSSSRVHDKPHGDIASRLLFSVRTYSAPRESCRHGTPSWLQNTDEITDTHHDCPCGCEGRRTSQPVRRCQWTIRLD